MPLDAASESPFRLQVCPRCDYSLTGLPEVGVCPECGREYDQQSIFLHGEAAGSRRNAWNSSGNQSLGRWISSICLIGLYIGIGFWHLHRVRFNIFPLINVPIIVLPLLIGLWRKMSDQGSGLIQVKLTPQGVRQGIRGMGPIPYEANDRAKLIPWRTIRSVRVGQLRNDQAHLVLKSSDRSLRLTFQYVNANVRCPPEQIEALRSRLLQWQKAAAV
jgi:hypothetical protein